MAGAPRKSRRPPALRGVTGDLFAATPPRAATVAAADPSALRRAVPRQLWLAVQLPALPLYAAAPAARRAAPEPLAVVAGEGAGRHVVACNAAAARAGLGSGLGLRAAHALVPHLAVCERVPSAERLELERLARWATGLTPCVSLEPPDALLLEVRGSLRLFGGAAALLERAQAGLEALGHAAALALAPTPRAASWLAHAAPGSRVESPALLAGALGRLAPDCTGWPAEALEQCTRLGLRTLGELRRLPRDGLARRFAPAVLAELDEAFGLRPAPRRRYVAPQRFLERAELPAEFEDLAGLAPYCAQLLEHMGHFLRVRDSGVAALRLTFLHRAHRPSTVTLGRAWPAADAAGWHDLLAERLARLRLPAPVCALVLRSAAIVPLAGSSAALPGVAAGEAEARAWALVDRLRARLGEAAVSGLCLVPEHRPEAAWRRIRPAPGRSPRHEREAVPVTAPRPLWLLASPEPLASRGELPCHDGALRLCSGPERIASGWWDGDGATRDYYVATTPGGMRLWIYRTHAAGGPRRWFLHGVFG